ncbi:MAG: DNA-3-methyladenine glycosylase I [Granulosicoccus sp.]|nr:DNA-3-methyladenine glycosylase I [Granulosicoccus sp.]
MTHDTETCPIPEGDPLFRSYHDDEWGVPASADRAFFEKICLEGFQSGLSWRTILQRRDEFRRAFDEFDMHRIAMYDHAEIDRLMQDKGIIRNRRKILSVINNARRALELQEQSVSLSGFCWSFEPSPESRPARVTRAWLRQNPASGESAALAGALKLRGWTYVGPVTMYALMQALGIVNDHVDGCHCRLRIETLRQSFSRPAVSGSAHPRGDKR